MEDFDDPLDPCMPAHVGWISPFKMALAFISGFCLSSTRLECDGFVSSFSSTGDSVSAIASALQSVDLYFYLLSAVQDSSSSITFSFSNLIHDLRDQCSTSVAKLVEQFLLQKFRETTQSLHHLQSTFIEFHRFTQPENLDMETSPSPIDPESPVGQFLIELCACAEVMLLEGLSQLLSEMKKYVQRDDMPKNMTDGSFSQPRFPVDVSYDTSGWGLIENDNFWEGNWDDEGKRSYASNPLLLEEFMQEQRVQIVLSAGKCHPVDIAAQIDHWKIPYQFSDVVRRSGTPFMLASLMCLQRADWADAITNSLSYYDYVLEGIRVGIDGQDGEGQNTNAGDIVSSLPLSVLNVAKVHLQFGHTERGLQALAEAIRVAQERSDTVCLAFALSWLLHVEWAKGDYLNAPMTEALLRHAAERASECQQQDICAANLLAAARYYWSDPYSQFTSTSSSSPQLSHVLQYRSTRHSLASAALIEALNNAERVASDNALHSFSSRALVARGISWLSEGFPHLGERNTFAALSLLKDYVEPTDVCLNAINLAISRYAIGDWRCGERILEDISKEYPYTLLGKNATLPLVIDVHLRRALNSGRYETARKLSETLLSCFTIGFPESHQFDYSHIPVLQSCRLLLRYGQLGSATSILQFCLGISTEVEMREGIMSPAATGSLSKSFPLHLVPVSALLPAQAMDYMLVQCEGVLRSGAALSALTHILSFLSLCEKNPHQSYRLQALLLLCQVYEEIHQPTRALCVAEGIADQVLQACDSIAVGELYLILGRVRLSIMHNTQDEAERRKHSYVQIIAHLKESVQHFVLMDAVESQMKVYHLLAIAYNAEGRKTERNEAARHYRLSLIECRKREAR